MHQLSRDRPGVTESNFSKQKNCLLPIGVRKSILKKKKGGGGGEEDY